MRFYSAWYQGDPIYSAYDDDCAMLISVTSVSKSWQLNRLKHLPNHLIIDSGGFRYATTDHKPPTPRDVFHRQEHIIKNIIQPVTLCALDYPSIGKSLSSLEKDRLLSKTLANAYEFKILTEKSVFRTRIQQLAIIQGYDFETTVRCAYELKNIGFDRYGIGSLAMLYDPKEILKRVEAVVEIVGRGVHVFGVSGLELIAKLQEMGVTSIDSTTPITNAKYNTLLYSKPYRKYIISTSKSATDKSRTEPRITMPLPCDCAVCKGQHKNDLVKLGKRRFVQLRAIHNYYHLKKAIQHNSVQQILS